MLPKGGENKRSDAWWENVLGSNLNDARTCGARQGEKAGKVEVVGEDDEAILASPSQNLGIACSLITDPGPVGSLEAVSGKVLRP